MKVVEILKDRLNWYRDCRAHDVLTIIPAGNGRKIELIYMQICMRSLTTSICGPSGPTAPNFVITEMLSSGYLIRPCEGGGSMIHIVDHLDLDVLEVVRLEGHGLNQDDLLARDLHML
ncbi:Homeobox-leucine zipper protein HOX32 [Platanthera zijinensis]|uniref:Homeobox-leucine zipper protein HOX32 n=1 Tax=Platanthera zijinensis TaxID=2320716 RepID=A0AAP0G4U0_9ASPA